MTSATSDLRIGFLGFGRYTRAFACHWQRKACGSAVLCYFDPFLSETVPSEFSHATSLENLVQEIDVLVIGLPNLVSDTISHLLRLRATLAEDKKSVRTLVTFDGLPLDEVFNGVDVDIVGVMINLNIAEDNSPIAVLPPVRGEAHDTTKRFFVGLERLGPCTVVLQNTLDLHASKLIVGMAPYLRNILPDQKANRSMSPLRSTLAFINEISGASIQSSDLDSVADCSQRAEIAYENPDEAAQDVGLAGGPTHRLQQHLNSQSCDLEMGLRQVWSEYTREMFAFSVEAITRTIEWEAPYFPRKRRETLLKDRLHQGLRGLMHNWPKLLKWANIIAYGSGGSHNAKIFYGREDEEGRVAEIEKHGLELYLRDPEGYRQHVCSMSSLTLNSKQLDSAWLITFVDNDRIALTGRHHSELSGIHVLYLPRQWFSGIEPISGNQSDSEVWKSLAAYDITKSQRSLVKAQLSWLSNELSDDLVDRVLRYFIWLHAIFGSDGLNSAIFLPASRGRAVPLGLTLGGTFSLGNPISTALASLTRSVFGLVIEWDAEENARRTACAAIMSRNLSHNVGSHALANSRFIESVGILHEITSSPNENPSAREGDHSYDGGVFRHKKTSFPIRNGEVWRARQRLATFNSFIQGRLDFIARALGESSSPPEPLFFFGDLIQGFFSQRVLLNTLLSDNGITIESMEFHVRLPKMKYPVVFKGVRDKHSFGPGEELRHCHFEKDGTGGHLRVKCTEELQDVLIAVPGGMVGRQAFYAFLENSMRNAAKYGRRPEGGSGKVPLVVRLHVREGAARQHDGGSRAEKVPCYWIEIDDNRSIDEPQKPGKGNEERAKGKVKGKGKRAEGKVTRTVRVHLNDPIITPDGKTQVEGHGIQEMKVCADFLGGQDLCFPTDDEISRAGFEVRLSNGIHWGDNDPYRDYISDSGRKSFLEVAHKGDVTRHAWITGDNPLQAYNRRLGRKLQPVGKGGSPHLTFRLILQKPVIFGIVALCRDGSTKQKDPIRQAEKNASVHYFNSVETLANEAAQFGLILVEEATQETIDATLLEIARRHTALPYRLMLVLPGAAEQVEALSEWRARIDFASAGELPEDEDRHENAIASGRPEGRVSYKKLGKDEDALRPGCLPARRLFVTRCPELFPGGIHIEVADFQEDLGLKVFQSVYEAWLRAWKGHELKAAGSEFWRLWIGFERGLDANGGSDIGKKWDRLKEFTSALLKVRVCVREPSTSQGNPGQRNADELWSNKNIPHDKAVDSKRNLIVFDNHGKVFTEVSEPSCSDGAPACYHSFSGSGQIDLFHTLESPPQDSFGLAYLIYSTVEASLMRIAVVDERVAEAMINEEKFLFGNLHTNLLNARILPIFQVQPGAGLRPIQLSPAVGEAIAKVDEEFSKRNGQDNSCGGLFGLSDNGDRLSEREGLHIDCQPERGIRAFTKRNEVKGRTMLSPIDSTENVDALVFHEGVADVISNKLGDKWESSSLLALFAETPGIIRTSGRGSQTRHLDRSLPFVEFTVVGSTTYQNLNKVALSRSVLGVRKGNRDNYTQ